VNDEKTTEIEIPVAVASNIVRVNFTERRKVSRVSAQMSAPLFPPARRAAAVDLDAQWKTPWWVRLLALAAILALSLFVL